MKKNLLSILKWLTLFLTLTNPQKTSKQIDLFNNLKSPIYINNQKTKNRGKIPKKANSGAFTITGFFKLEKFEENFVNILKVYNDIKKKQKKGYEFNPLFPICPYSKVFLEKFVQYQKDYNVKNNPNCFLGKTNQKGYSNFGTNANKRNFGGNGNNRNFSGNANNQNFGRVEENGNNQNFAGNGNFGGVEKNKNFENSNDNSNFGNYQNGNNNFGNTNPNNNFENYTSNPINNFANYTNPINNFANPNQNNNFANSNENNNFENENENFRNLNEVNNYKEIADTIETVFSLDIINTNNNYFLKADFPTEIKNEKDIIYNKKDLENMEIKINSWIFFGISFNYPENEGTFYLKIYGNNKTEKIIKKKFILRIENFFLHKNYFFYYSENPELIKNRGLIYDVNISYNYLNNLELFSFLNMSEKILKINNKIIEFKFEKTRSNRQIINSLGSITKEFQIQGYYLVEKKGGVHFHEKSFVKLDKILENLENTLIKSPTFFLSFKIMNLKKKIFLVSSENGLFSVFAENKGKGFFFGMEYFYNKKSFVFKSDRIFNFNEDLEIAFCLSFSDNRLEFLIFFADQSYEKSQIFLDLEIDFTKFGFFLLSENNDLFNIIVYRFLVLENPLPFVMQNQKSLDKFDLDCKTFLIPNISDKNICLNCENSVLDSDDQKCTTFCKSGEKNVNGICQKCLKNTCEEITTPFLTIKDIDNKNFKINLSEKLFQNNLKTLKNDLELEFSPFLNKTSYNYTITEINENELNLNLSTKTKLLNTTLTIKLNDSKLEDIHTSNREKIENFKISLKLKKSKNLSNFEKFYLDILAYIIIGIFWFLFLIGIILFFLHLKKSFNDFSFKKLGYVFTNIQILSLLIFCSVHLPANFSYFTNKIFHYTLRFLSLHNFFKEKIQNFEFNKKFINFENNDISPLIIDNLGILIFLHIIIILFYLITKILVIINKIKPFSSKKRENIFLVKNNFEFNVLINIFVLFSVPIFSFVILDLKELNYKSDFATFSIIVAIGYVIVFIFGLVFFSILFFMNSGFRNFSLIKDKLDYFFIGYNSTKNANLYEIIEIVINCLIGLVLTGFYQNSAFQITFLLFLSFLKLLVLAMIKPHLDNFFKFTDFFNKILWIFVFLLISCILMFDENSDSQIENIGFILIIIFCVMIFFEFLISFLFSIKYLANLKKNGNFTNNFNFQKIGNLNNNSLVAVDQSKNSFQSIQSKDFLQKPINKTTDFKKSYETLNKQNDSYFEEKEELKNKSIRSNIKKKQFKEDLNDLKSGKGSHHDSYISRSENSIIIQDKRNI